MLPRVLGLIEFQENIQRYEHEPINDDGRAEVAEFREQRGQGYIGKGRDIRLPHK